MKTRLVDGVEVHRGSGNLFADLGLADAEKLKIKNGLVIFTVRADEHDAEPQSAKLAVAKAALHMPATNPQTQACAQDFMARVNTQQCPACGQGRWGVVQTLAGAKRLHKSQTLWPENGLSRRQVRP